jgi:hypothetical protein
MCGMLHVPPCLNIPYLVQSNNRRSTSSGRTNAYLLSRSMNSFVSMILYCADSRMLPVIRNVRKDEMFWLFFASKFLFSMLSNLDMRVGVHLPVSLQRLTEGGSLQ